MNIASLLDKLNIFSSKKNSGPPPLVHRDSESLHDPNYDHDHSRAHGLQELDRIRAMSFSHQDLNTSQTIDRRVPNGLGTVSEESEFVEEVVKARARRRLSHDQLESKKIILNVEDVQGRILSQEDTDGDMKITVTDDGPKLLTVGTLSSHGHNKVELRGHYALANLLQELAIASDHGRRRIVLDSDRLHENPVQRLSRLIKHHFWDALTRRMDADGIEMICNDPKNRNGDGRLRIYIPFNDSLAWDYYQSVAKQKPHLNLDLVRLPEKITPEYVYSIYSKFGVLSLALKEVLDENGNSKIKAVPYVVPGGRFNEMYGWDSYFESLGLIVDGRVELAKAMVENFTYQINHYGKILNANRSYYLTRSQPPFFTDMILQTYRKLADTLYKDQPAQLKNWLMRNFQAAIKEYYNVWMSPPRYVDDIGLSRYHPEGYGMPPETESSHFDAILTPYAEKMGISVAEYSKGYAAREIIEPELDEYFIHDRAVRESGHDTTYRLEGKCAYIIPVDLNCLLYKYEIDIGNTIRDHFDDDFVTAEGQKEKSSVWFDRAEKRKELIEKYLWNEQKGMYFDYNLKEKQQSDYESVTNFFVLWAGIATRHRAAKLIPVCLKKFEVKGGLVTGTQESKGITSISRPNRQWDYPFGWAPLQMVSWKGLVDYGYEDIARCLAYRWLYMLTKSFVDHNGVVPEKFDAVNLDHNVHVEYGNVGTDFKMIPREGFGWMNASYKVGLSYLNRYMTRALGALVDPDQLMKKIKEKEDAKGGRLSSDYTSSSDTEAELLA